MSTPVFDPARLQERIDRFAGRRIVVLGDLMLDHYLWGRCERISPEAPVPVVEIERETSSLGGAGNVAANLAALGARPVLVGVLGDDNRAQQLLDAFTERGVDTRALVRDASRPTTIKTRILAQHQQVVRADWESRADLAGAALAAALDVLARELPQCEGLIVSDYGKGVVTAPVLERALGLAKTAGVPIAVDPKESHIDAYRGVSILTPNQHEAGWVMGRRVTDDSFLVIANAWWEPLEWRLPGEPYGPRWERAIDTAAGWVAPAAEQREPLDALTGTIEVPPRSLLVLRRLQPQESER